MQHHRFFASLAVVSLALAVLTTPAPGQTVPRKVLAEDFAATWCVPCRDVGSALRLLQDDNPDSLVAIQVHLQDAYAVDWGVDRGNAYGIPHFPFVWIDAELDQENGDVGSVDQNYDVLESMMNQRLAVPTDVSVEMWAEEIEPLTYRVFARTSVTPDGEDKSVRPTIIQTLKDHPAGETYYFNGVMDGITGIVRPIAAGGSLTMTRTFTLTGESAMRPEDVQFIAWAEAPPSGGPGEVLNAEVLNYPFAEIIECPSDVDGDGTVGFFDLVALLTWWGPCADCPEDIDGNGDVGFSDLLLVLNGWGDCS